MDSLPKQKKPQAADIKISRLRNDIETVAKIGWDSEKGGVCRPGFSVADIDAREWLATQMTSCGLRTHIDAAGNVIGRWEVGERPALLIGSHLDSVPNGGILDGTLGVLAGLEVVRSMMDQGFSPARPIEIVATSEEEGRFGGMLGSQALTGAVQRDWLYSAKDDEGALLVDCLKARGFEPDKIIALRRPPESIHAFLELHIEQGPVLETKNITIGIVEGISGVFHWTVCVTGQANHAGTTPMDMRHDSFAATAEFAHCIPEIIEEFGSVNSRITIGKVSVEPGFAHTVPGVTTFSIVGKDMDERVMKNLATACQNKISKISEKHGAVSKIDELSWLGPQPCDPQVMDVFLRAADHLGISSLSMPSGAGHDTQVMAAHSRAGMIFIPSRGGISHSPEEHTDWDDIASGTQVLLHAAKALSSS